MSDKQLWKGRRPTRSVRAGSLIISGTAPVSVQSMTNTDTSDFKATAEQTKALAEAGCDAVRIAVPDKHCVGIFEYIRQEGITVPLIADIHFDYRLAIESVRHGADKVRVNPGNLGGLERLFAVADVCAERNVPIRIGVNSGSIQKSLLEKYGSPTAEALAESALEYVRALEREGFYDIVVSVKSSDVMTMVEASRIVAENCECPIHIGVTEAGTPQRGTIKNAVGIGALLCLGIGDTIRVSLSSDPLLEVKAGRCILDACGLSSSGIDLISCPTCGRTKINLFDILSELENRLDEIDTKGKRIKVAVMGCAVNGPGEARSADVGIAGGNGDAVIFRHGEIIGRVTNSEAAEALIREIYNIINED